MGRGACVIVSAPKEGEILVVFVYRGIYTSVFAEDSEREVSFIGDEILGLTEIAIYHG